MTRSVFTHATIEPRGEQWRVYLWGSHGRGSVLEGQPMRQYYGDWPTVRACRAELERERPHLPIEVLEHATMRPYVSLAHLPGEDDPVPGGALPDDVGEWPPLP